MIEDLDRDDWSLEQLLEVVLDARQDELHTAVPGRIESYDASAQTADVTPMVRRALSRLDGSRVSEAMPTVRAVPIVWPRAGEWFVHMPLAAGDFVLLVVCERDPARWRVTGELSDPIDRRAHHLAHAVAIPGVYPRTRELGDTPSDALVIGRDGGATLRVRSDGKIDVAGDKELVLAENLGEHLSAISKGLDAVMGAITTGATEANYGVAAKRLLDGTHPIATTNTRGA